MKHKKEYNFIIELDIDCEYNAYIYESVIKSSDVFDMWSKMINDLKITYPANLLLKGLGSKCWGVISERNNFCINDDDLMQNLDKYKDCKIIRTVKNGEYGEDDYKEIHYIQNKDNAYKYNVRIKSQITSFARCQIANFALTDIKNVVRIHTDCVSFKTEQNYDKTLFKLEKKSSGGFIIFKNVNKYFNVCQKCNTELKYNKFVTHAC